MLAIAYDAAYLATAVAFQATDVFANDWTLDAILYPFTAEDELALRDDHVKALLANGDNAVEALAQPLASEYVPKTIANQLEGEAAARFDF